MYCELGASPWPETFHWSQLVSDIVLRESWQGAYVVTTSVGITGRDDQLSSTRVANASDSSLVVLHDERGGHVVGLTFVNVAKHDQRYKYLPRS